MSSATGALSKERLFGGEFTSRAAMLLPFGCMILHRPHGVEDAPRLSATSVQTVGAKKWDGFALALVVA